MVINQTMIEAFLSERTVKYDKESKTYWLVAIHSRCFRVYSDFQICPFPCSHSKCIRPASTEASQDQLQS